VKVKQVRIREDRVIARVRVGVRVRVRSFRVQSFGSI
jgi:hypothetical protein